jgi:hypothetical protein
MHQVVIDIKSLNFDKIKKRTSWQVALMSAPLILSGLATSDIVVKE